MSALAAATKCFGGSASSLMLSSSSSVNGLQQDNLDDNNGNTNNICGCYVNNSEDNGNNLQSTIPIVGLNRNKNEIRITENPIPEPVVC